MNTCAELVGRIVATAPGVRVLATSRGMLGGRAQAMPGRTATLPVAQTQQIL